MPQRPNNNIGAACSLALDAAQTQPGGAGWLITCAPALTHWPVGGGNQQQPAREQRDGTRSAGGRAFSGMPQTLAVFGFTAASGQPGWMSSCAPEMSSRRSR